MIGSVYVALGFACIVFLLLPSRRLAQPYRWLLLLALLGLSQLPIDGVSLAGHWRASVAEHAVTTTVLLLVLSWRRLQGLRPSLPARVHTPLQWMGVFALPFYLMAMGATTLDPYRIGFAPNLLLGAILLLTLWSWYRGALWVAVALAAATLLFALNALTSDNYWDYLVDPIVAVFGLNLAIRRGWRRLQFRRQKAQRQRVAAVG